MKPAARWAIAVGIFVVLGGALLTGGDDWEQTRTSYGAIPPGFGALYQLLEELELSRGRSFSEGLGLPAAATVWWIAPRGLCKGVLDGDLSDAESGIWHSMDWVERGGTAVIFLPALPLPCLEDIEIAGMPLPVRMSDPDVIEYPLDEEDEVLEEQAEEWVRGAHGPLHPRPRSLGEIPLNSFEWSEGFETLASTASGRALVVSRSLGEGRLVFVAISAPLSNEWLDHHEASLFAVDLVLALGTPFLDEREHGLLPSPSAIPYLLGSLALPAFGGAALLALLVLWWGRAQLPPRLETEDARPPSLEAFIASIARLYASTRDYDEVLRCYREFALSQLRRAFLLPPDVSTRIVCDRVLASRDLSPEDLQPLLESPPVGHMATLLSEAARIDSVVAEVTG